MKKILILVASMAIASLAATDWNNIPTLTMVKPTLSYRGNAFSNDGVPGYAYAAATVYYDGKFHQFFCSQGMATDSTFYHPDKASYFTVRPDVDNFKSGYWDFIRYRTSQNGQTYTGAHVVLTPTKGLGEKSGTETCTCDPAVIKHGSYWYLYYTGAKKGLGTVVYVARSKNIQGPYDRLTEDYTWERWPKNPMPILKLDPTTDGNAYNSYGVGQLSVVKKTDKNGISTFHFWFTVAPDKKTWTYKYMTSSTPFPKATEPWVSKKWTSIALDGTKALINCHWSTETGERIFSCYKKNDGHAFVNCNVIKIGTDSTLACYDAQGRRNDNLIGPQNFTNFNGLGWYKDFGEVRWNPSANVYELWITSVNADALSEGGLNNYILKYTSTDGINWKPNGKIGPYNFMHNVGVSGDENGWVKDGRSIVTFSVPSNGGLAATKYPSTGPFDLYQIMVGSFQPSTLSANENFADTIPSKSKPSKNLEVVNGDFDGDGITDLGVVDRATSKWYIRSSKTGKQGTPFVPWGKKLDSLTSASTILVADYDGDGITDLAFINKSTGKWFITSSRTKSYFVDANSYQVKGKVYNKTDFPWTSTCIPLTGDYDGDGKADIGFFKPSTGEWYIYKSSSGSLVRKVFSTMKSGVPVEGDYDGDGITDYATYNKSNGKWNIIASQTGAYLKYNWGPTYADEYQNFVWGGPDYTSIAGNFDGDGKADLTLICPSSKIWIHKSWRHAPQNVPFKDMSASSQYFVGDYDGDGISDEGVFNKSTRKLYIHSSLKNSIGFSGVKVNNLYSFSSKNYLAKTNAFDEENYDNNINFAQAPNLKVSINGDLVNVSGLIPGDQVVVYNMMGQTIVNKIVHNSETSFAKPKTGMYIIKSGAQMTNFSIK